MGRSQEKPSLIGSLTTRLFVIALLALTTLGSVWLYGEYRNFERQARQTRELVLEKQKTLLRDIVQHTVAYINYARRQAENRTRRTIRERVEEAHAIATHLWNTYRETRSREEIAVLIREALRPIRFNDGRGYFFAFDMNGIEKLFADRPELEGTDMTTMQDAEGAYVVPDMIDIVRRQGEGFYSYIWTRPGSSHDRHRKLAYVKGFEPLGWVIGTGEYVTDVERDIQREVLAWVETIRFGEDGYVFAGQYDGLMLTWPARNRNMWEVEDANGVKVIQELVALAQAGGGFLRYIMPPVGEPRSAPKLTYVQGVPEWNWHVGAGMYEETIEAAVEKQRVALERKVLMDLAQIAAALALLALGVFLMARRTAHRVAASHQAFRDFFATAAKETKVIDAESMPFRELTELARSANAMVEARREVEEELARRRVELERSNADLERFAYVASHDLQEPLRTITSFLQLLERRAAEHLDPEARDYIAYATQGAKRMRQQILDLLAYSRLDAGPPELVETDLTAAARTAVDDLREAIADSGAQIAIGPLPVVPAVPGLVETLFRNLISNAMKFQRPGEPPRVEITAEQDGDGTWVFAVTDHGIGIPEEHLASVFEVFRRLHPADRYPGTGIGLAVCKKIVSVHGGRIWAESRLGGPTSIRFTLTPPQSRAAAPRPAAMTEAAAPS